MATNDFLVFGGGAGANVLAQAAWAALAARTTGFSSGVAQSAQLNKAWRQSSIMAAILGQFIADVSGQDALDDGTTITLLANLKAAVRAQSNSVIGSVRNAKMNVATASATATFTADEVIVESALGALTYRVPSLAKTINLATTGVGGMDAGAAPANGFVAVYVIYNPANGSSGLLAVNATTSIQPEVYGGSNMPAGYTASALVGVWPTNGSGQFAVGHLIDRQFYFPYTIAATTNVGVGTATAVSVATLIPRNAKACSGWSIVVANGSSYANVNVSGSASTIGLQQIAGATFGGNGSISGPFSNVPLITPQTIYWSTTATGGTYTSASMSLSGYTF